MFPAHIERCLALRFSQASIDAALSGASSCPQESLIEDTALEWRQALLDGDKVWSSSCGGVDNCFLLISDMKTEYYSSSFHSRHLSHIFMPIYMPLVPFPHPHAWLQAVEALVCELSVEQGLDTQQLRTAIMNSRKVFCLLGMS